MKNIKKSVVLFSTLGLFLLIMPGSEVLADEAELAGFVPPDPLVYLEVKDLASVLNALVEPRLSDSFIKSKAFADFTLSKLANKLADRIKALEEATGFGLTVKNLQSVAGSRTAFSLYDIGELQFIFLTKVSAEKVLASSLWNLKDSFESRAVENTDTDYFVKEDPYGQVSFAFALVGDTLLVGTDLLRFELSLKLLKDGGDSLAKADQFKDAFDGSAEYDDILLYLDQSRINSSTYFRSYWIYGNQADLQDIDSVGITVAISNDEIREIRKIHRSQMPRKMNSKASTLARMLRVNADYTEYGNISERPEFLKSLMEGFIPARDKTALDNLVETLSPAHPRDYGMALSFSAVKDFHQDVQKIVALRLENKAGFNRRTFEASLAEAYSKSLLAAGIGELKFVDRDDTRILEIPLFENSAPAYRLVGDVLLVAQSPALLAESSSSDRQQEQLLADNDSLCSAIWLDIEGAFSKSKSLLEVLSGANTWSSTSNAGFFSSNLTSMFGILANIKEMTVLREIRNKTVVETVSYKLKN